MEQVLPYWTDFDFTILTAQFLTEYYIALHHCAELNYWNYVTSAASFIILWREGVQAQNFWKVYFELWDVGRCQDMCQQLKGGFGSINPMLPMWGRGP